VTKRSKGALAPLALLLMAGCGTTQITTPEAMRDYVRAQRMMSKFETFEVQRPYAAVTRDLKRRSEDCLDREFKITRVQEGIVLGSRERADGTTRYIPVSNIGATKAEFYTKFWDSKARAVNTPAGDKMVFYVADVTPKGRNATSIDLYSWNVDRYRWGETAVKAWARGEDPGCPTLNGMY
jgi:hypothetical protein